eukprot:15483108-Alexandrium_andersonii.AAC.1
MPRTMDAVCLLASAHGAALRMVCDKLGAHYGGVAAAAAARQARRRNVITMQKKLTNLDPQPARPDAQGGGVR